MTEAVLEDSADLLLENLQLTEDHYLKRAATLLFYDNPERFATGAYVKIGFSSRMMICAIRMRSTATCSSRSRGR